MLERAPRRALFFVPHPVLGGISSEAKERKRGAKSGIILRFFRVICVGFVSDTALEAV